MFENAQQTIDQAHSDALRGNPQIQAALRGVYTGKYAELAKQLPAAWSPQTRNIQVANAIARDLGISTSGLDATDNYSLADRGVPFVVQAAPYVMGAVGVAGAAGALGGAGGSSAYVGADVAKTAAATYGSNIAGGAGSGAIMTGATYADLLKTGGGIVSSLIQSNASGKASAGQLALQQQALDYEKANDLYNRGLAATALTLDNQRYDATRTLEASRYGDYQGRILPFVQNGTSSNDRMAALLGLPARSGSSSGSSGGPSGGSPSGSSDSQGAPPPLTAAQQAAVPGGDYEAWFNGLVAGKPYTQQTLLDLERSGALAKAGVSLTPPNAGGDRTKLYVPGQGWVRVGFGEGKPVYVPQGDFTPPRPLASPTPTSTPTTPATSAGGSVQMRGPEGSVKTVNQTDVAHYQSLGATVIAGAAV